MAAFSLGKSAFLFVFFISVMMGELAVANVGLSGVSVSNISASTAEISWRTKRSSTSKIEYSLDPSLAPSLSLVQYDPAFLTRHRLVLTGLRSDSVYYYRVSSAGSGGTYSQSSILSFRTAPSPVILQPAPAPAPAPDTTAIPMISTEWQIAYDGYGFVNFDALTGSVVFAPKAADPNGPLVDISNTHATLLLANRFLKQPLRNFRVTLVATTEAQLRTPTANAWECFWFFFNYTVDSTGKKKTNYFTLKPNGFEMGTAFDEVGQNFLATGSSPQLVIGKPNTFVIEKINGVVKASIDGVAVMNYDSLRGPHPVYDVAGTIGLYSEDARVRVHSVKVEPLP